MNLKLRAYVHQIYNIVTALLAVFDSTESMLECKSWNWTAAWIMLPLRQYTSSVSIDNVIIVDKGQLKCRILAYY